MIKFIIDGLKPLSYFMTDQIASTNANPRVNDLGKKLIRITLLLLSLQVINALMPAMLWVSGIGLEGLFIIRDYSSFIGSTIFGCLVYAMMKRNPVAIPVSLLACLLPLYGGILYLFSTTLQDYE